MWDLADLEHLPVLFGKNASQAFDSGPNSSVFKLV